jgi:hypothetical protein
MPKHMPRLGGLARRPPERLNDAVFRFRKRWTRAATAMMMMIMMILRGNGLLLSSLSEEKQPHMAFRPIQTVVVHHGAIS